MGIRQVQVGCEFVYDAQVNTPTVLQVTPLGVDGVSIHDEQWLIKPDQDHHEYRDIYSPPVDRRSAIGPSLTCRTLPRTPTRRLPSWPPTHCPMTCWFI
jgi:hypothetical protein